MKVFSLLLFCVFALRAEAKCQLRSPVVSLSAPITALLEDLGLLADPQLRGISLFHPTTVAASVPRLGGGLFLAQKTLAQFAGQVVLFDESGELQRRLTEAASVTAIPVRTRSLDPFEVTFLALDQLAGHLSGCDVAVARLRARYQVERTWLLAQKPFPKRMHFFLGTLTPTKWPELLMVADGPVLFWVRHQKLRTFDSQLAYVRWGEKWKKGLGTDDVLVGLSEAPAPFALSTGAVWNARGPGVLTPGPWQIRFMRSFVESVQL